MRHIVWAAAGMAFTAVVVSLVLLGLDFQSSGGTLIHANQPSAGLEFTVHVGGCNTAGDQKGTCTVTEGSTFVASVSLDAIPGPYEGVVSTIGYSGVTSKDNPEPDWPGCVGTIELIVPAGVHAGCTVGPPFIPVTYTGTIMTASFNCAADGALYLVHGIPDTGLLDDNQKLHTETGPDVLNIDCAPPSVAGVAFDTGTSGNGAGAIAVAVGLALAAGACGLGYAGWRAYARRER